jgi:hypothetical protein
MVNRHLRGTLSTVGKLFVTGEVCASEAVDALLRIADDNKRARVSVAKKRLKNSNLGRVAVLALINDRGAEAFAYGLSEHSMGTLGIECVTDDCQDVIERSDSGDGFAERKFGLDLLVEQRGRAICFSEEVCVRSR